MTSQSVASHAVGVKPGPGAGFPLFARSGTVISRTLAVGFGKRLRDLLPETRRHPRRERTAAQGLGQGLTLDVLL